MPHNIDPILHAKLPSKEINGSKLQADSNAMTLVFLDEHIIPPYIQ